MGEPQVPFGDVFAGMGMGRGKALAPPPGLRTLGYRGHRAPGGLSKEWRPEPIPEELDSEHQEMGTPRPWVGATWDSDVLSPELLAAATAAVHFGDGDRTPSHWSKASYCG